LEDYRGVGIGSNGSLAPHRELVFGFGWPLGSKVIDWLLWLDLLGLSLGYGLTFLSISCAAQEKATTRFFFSAQCGIRD